MAMQGTFFLYLTPCELKGPPKSWLVTYRACMLQLLAPLCILRMRANLRPPCADQTCPRSPSADATHRPHVPAPRHKGAFKGAGPVEEVVCLCRCCTRRGMLLPLLAGACRCRRFCHGHWHIGQLLPPPDPMAITRAHALRMAEPC